MEIQYGKNEKGMTVINIPDECKENVVDIIEQINKNMEISVYLFNNINDIF